MGADCEWMRGPPHPQQASTTSSSWINGLMGTGWDGMSKVMAPHRLSWQPVSSGTICTCNAPLHHLHRPTELLLEPTPPSLTLQSLPLQPRSFVKALPHHISTNIVPGTLYFQLSKRPANIYTTPLVNVDGSAYGAIELDGRFSYHRNVRWAFGVGVARLEVQR